MSPRVVLAAGLLLASPMSGATPPATISVSTVPDAVYRNPDGGHGDTESWFFNLVVADSEDRAEIRPVELVSEIFRGQSLLERRELPAETLADMRRVSYEVTPDTPPLSLRRRFSVDEVFDLPLAFRGIPLAWKADHVRLTLRLDVPGRDAVTRSLDVPIQTFRQKTQLTFPLRGPGIVTQGQINNFGHSGHANRFAVDVMALDPRYAPMAGETNDNAAFAGWGHEVVAPAAGKVVYARNDVPDNTPGVDPETVYSKVHDPILAIGGNCVVIDHGTGELSVLMHMRRGSVAVKVGEEVRAGQMIGRMGNSGDSFAVHLHYQLQDGPELFRANSLPFTFSDLQGVEMVRGSYFEASPPGEP
jgi:murein DD-endopeptidase MepM/ murein hydrolase activator NlpD